MVTNVLSAIQRTIPISLFSRGLASQIFKDVKERGPKVVMKNNVAECVLISPDEYTELMEEIYDARLLSVAAKRMQNYDPAKVISQEEIDREFGISEEDLEGYDEVEIE